jgi:hypothetical protein
MLTRKDELFDAGLAPGFGNDVCDEVLNNSGSEEHWPALISLSHFKHVVRRTTSPT